MANRWPGLSLSFSIAIFLLATCQGSPSTPTQKSLASELIIRGWPDDLPQSILDDFTNEYGVAVRYMAYEDQESAIQEMRAGEVYDLVVLDNQYLAPLIADGLLAQIDYRNVPNFKNISANFRDLAHDPGNRYSVPYNWGTTGLVVLGDLVEGPITHWADAWDPRYAGRVAVWPIQRYLIGVALHVLGYSINSEEPQELEAALERLLALKSQVILLDLEWDTATPVLANGQAVMAMGWAADVWETREVRDDVLYVLPKEGAILWGDNFVIPANSPRRATAETFLNFVLRPEISARFSNENHYATPNEAAWPLVDPEILADPVVYPPNEDLENAEILLSLSPAGQRLYDEIWERFLEAEP